MIVMAFGAFSLTNAIMIMVGARSGPRLGPLIEISTMIVSGFGTEMRTKTTHDHGRQNSAGNRVA